MAALLINDNGDGTFTVAPCDPDEQMLAEGETVQSLEEATQLAGDVLGGGGEAAPDGEQAEEAAEGTPDPDAAMESQEQPPRKTPEGMMGMGYREAKRGG